MADLLLGIDVGTSGAKAILIDSRGVVQAAHTTPHELLAPKPQWSEQHPADWWLGCAASIRQALAASGAAARDIAAVGLTGQMHGLVLLDARGEILRPAILWNDQRTAAQCDAIHDRVGFDRVLRITGKPVLTGFTAPKMLWVRENEPDVFARAEMMLLPKDYVRYRMSDAFATDVADASGTSVFDVGARAWSAELLEALELKRERLPEVYESPDMCARVSAEGAKATGLLEGTPIVAGAGDQAAEAVGCGIVDEGAVSVTIGTSGVVFASTPSMRVDPKGRLHAYCHAAPGLWHVMGVMLSAGGCMQWYRDALCASEKARAEREGIDAYDLLTREAAEIEPGSEGLIFLPYLTGERTPHADPHARGVFFGLTRRHTKAHLTRALMEGVTFGLRDLFDLTRELGVPVRSTRISGGGARSALWRQMLADILRTDVTTVNVTQGAAYGAALLAGVGARIFPSVPEAASSIVRDTSTTTPGPDLDRYRGPYDLYRTLYPTLRKCFRRL